MSASRDRRRFVVLLLLPLAGAAGTSYLLWGDLQEDARVGKGAEVIAQIDRSAGDVKRRPADRFRWFKIGSNRKLYVGDSVSTGNEGRMGVTFQDGSSIQLGPNTLFTVESRPGKKFAINVSAGTFQFKGAPVAAAAPVAKPKAGEPQASPTPAPAAESAPVIEADGKVLEIAGAEGTTRVEEGLVSMDVRKGEAQVRNGNLVEKVEAGEGLGISSDGSQQRSDNRVDLSAPGSREIFTQASVGQAVEVRFEWTSEASGSHELELSSEPLFGKVWQSVSSADRRAQLKLPAGRYFWRVKAPDGKISRTDSFEVAQPAPPPVLAVTPGEAKPEPSATAVAEAPPEAGVPAPTGAFELLPASGTRVLLTEDGQGKLKRQPLRLKWSVEQPLTGVVLKVLSADGKVVGEKKYGGRLEAGEWIYQAERPGVYRWEVRAPVERSPEDLVSSAEFSVEVAHRSIEEPVVSVAGTDKRDNVLGARLIKRDLDLQVKWKPVPGATQYRVVFSRSEAFEEVHHEETTGDTASRLDSKEFPFNPVFYRVESTLTDGQVVTSPVSKFSFKFLAPLLSTPADGQRWTRAELYQRESDSVLFSWWHTNFTEGYLIEISKSPEFKKLVAAVTVKDNFYIAKHVDSGTYWWRVKSVRPPVVSDPSPARKFTIVD